MSGLLAPGEFAGDDGTADPALAAALAGTAAAEDPATRSDRLAHVVRLLPAARLLVPVVAVLGDTDQSSLTGLTTDKNADMALVTLTAPDGRVTLPVFSSAAELSRWDARARPVPVGSRRAALAAVQEACELLVIDPAGAAVVVPRPALWALAQGTAWAPSWRNVAVVDAVRAAVGADPAVVAVRTEPGTRAELAVVLRLRPGLDRAAVEALTARATSALAASQQVADDVDSVQLRLESG